MTDFPNAALSTIARLGIWCAIAASAHAAAINYTSLQLVSPAFASGTHDAIVSGAIISGSGYSYTLSAELCQSGACSFDSSGPVKQVLELSNVSVFCNSSGLSCGPLDLSFQASYTASAGSQQAIDLSLDNTVTSAQPFTGFARICFSDANNICSASLLGPTSVEILFSSADFSGDGGSTYIIGNGPYSLLGLFHIDGLANGDSFSIGHSLTVTSLTLVGSSPSPEPSTVGLVALGACVLALARRRRWN